MRTSRLVLPLLGMVAGCGKEPPGPTEPLVARAIQLAPTSSGDQQTGTVGKPLSHPVRVLVKIVFGGRSAPAAGVTVRWTAVGDSLGTTSGSISPAIKTTDAAGIASATWTLGGQAGQQVAHASIAGAQDSQDSAVGFTAFANPGPAFTPSGSHGRGWDHG